MDENGKLIRLLLSKTQNVCNYRLSLLFLKRDICDNFIKYFITILYEKNIEYRLVNSRLIFNNGSYLIITSNIENLRGYYIDDYILYNISDLDIKRKIKFIYRIINTNIFAENKKIIDLKYNFKKY